MKKFVIRELDELSAFADVEEDDSVLELEVPPTDVVEVAPVLAPEVTEETPVVMLELVLEEDPEDVVGLLPDIVNTNFVTEKPVVFGGAL